MSILDAKKNDELIPLSDSLVLRFIDQINEVDQVQRNFQIDQIRKALHSIKHKPKSVVNRQQVVALYDQLDTLQFIQDYLCIIIDKISDYHRANKGFTINGIKYKRLLGTTGGVKSNTIVYVSEKSKNNKVIYEEIKKRLNNGRDENKALVPAKFEAYQSLACSSSLPVSMPKGVLVVHDCITHFQSDYIRLDDTDSLEPKMTLIEKGSVELNDSDGYGLILPSLAFKWAKDIHQDYLFSGCCIRNSFCKGMVFTFDFIDFAKKIANKETVFDVWGKEHQIQDIELILTTSMLKLWDSYNSIEDYLHSCNQHQYTFCITKTCPQKLEHERNLNYQFIQSYDLTDEDMDALIQPTVDEIKDILGGDINKTLLFLKGAFLDEANLEDLDCDFIKALMVDPRMIHDPFVLSKIDYMVKNRIKEAKIGVLKINGNFSIVSGDPFSLCQSLFGLEVTGLLKSGQFYSKYWNDRTVQEVCCFRAPMTCHNNIRILTLSNTEEMQYWYQYMTTVTIFNSWDTAAHALNGLDKDSDAILTTNSPPLLKNTKKLPAILCIQRKAEKKKITEEDLVYANINSFGDEIGTTTNRITTQFDVQSQFPKNSLEYEILDYRIKCGQLYQQNAIDKAKGILANPVPKEWYDSFTNKILPTDDPATIKQKTMNLKLMAHKKPYFMNYIYPQQMMQYKKYSTTANKKSLMEFRLSLDQLIPKENKTPEEQAFVLWYDKKMPVGMNPCLMNRICWKIETIFNDDLKTTPPHKPFDYVLLKSHIPYSKQNFKDVYKIYTEYSQLRQAYQLKIKKERILPQDSALYKAVLKEEFKKQCLSICSDEKELCDIVLDICYKKNSSKQFAWDISGDVMIHNLLKQNNNKIYYFVQCNDGSIEFGGNKFIRKYKIIGDDKQ